MYFCYVLFGHSPYPKVWLYLFHAIDPLLYPLKTSETIDMGNFSAVAVVFLIQVSITFKHFDLKRLL